jgi:hypothetical protein
MSKIHTAKPKAFKVNRIEIRKQRTANIGVCSFAGRRINPHLLVRYQHWFWLTEFYWLLFLTSSSVISWGFSSSLDIIISSTAASPEPLAAMPDNDFSIK